jgi:hypothetical protein
VIDSSRSGALVGAGPSRIASSRLPDAGELGDRQPLTPLPPGPARASTAARPRAASGIGRRAREWSYGLSHHVAAGGALIH